MIAGARVILKPWLPAVAIMALIFLMSSIPAGDLPSLGGADRVVKKGGHLVAYALLSVAYLHGLGMKGPRGYLSAWLMAVAYGATDEFHQTFTSGRGAWIGDVGIDAVGAALGLLIPWSLRNTFLGSR